MGYAHGFLMADYILAGHAELKSLLGGLYNVFRNDMAGAVWKPDEIEDELDGMVDALALIYPEEDIDKLDLKVANGYSDWSYGVACRSHACWGSFVSPPVKTLATRRLDFYSPFSAMNHHVICAWEPDDGSPKWINAAWAGYAVVVTGINEYGTLASLHDYNTGGTVPSSAMPRSVAARYILTMPDGPGLTTHLTDGYAEIQNYNAYTGSFINYYAPEGYGGVITCSRAQGFYDLRMPQLSYFNGEVLITANAWTDGTYTPSGAEFIANYYDEGGPKDQESHWNVMLSSELHMMSVAYRGHGDMTLWFHGRLDPGYTPRLEGEWEAFFGNEAEPVRVRGGWLENVEEKKLGFQSRRYGSRNFE